LTMLAVLPRIKTQFPPEESKQCAESSDMSERGTWFPF
jgi:hypothetical protein